MSIRRQPYNDGLGPVFEIIGGKWKGVLLWELNAGPVRFGALKRRVKGISEKILIQQLREMEADGLVHRKMFHQVPPRVEYSVTPLGASLNEALSPLCEWGKCNLVIEEGNRKFLNEMDTPSGCRNDEREMT
ncbi:helix-turn-helix domain-containing protein [Rhizobium sp. AB2/73]|uniref:winged helix-turn-helix transcriptional regulator n=1 Tax=Rhizobium sp. AB2/73 TaxID=2795216 RepID=UPI001C5CD448|nr:helix-turn-helix domain-containing protein [Rhizobium sp. AB2/73]QYA13187.1 helix-turn-helix transcriptional regulator [Rhizobium sp. AB2/73]UEQ80880.1 helix-turn-helix transcriptional regulator [Rhizobium sp. AB2/73]